MKKNRRGFTLLELMVVLSLMGVVSTIGITGFFRMTDYWNTLQENLRLNKNAAIAFDAISGDMENMLSGTVVGVGLQGVHSDTEDSIHFWRITFEDDSIAFPVQLLNPLTNEYEQLILTYAVQRGNQEPCLIRKSAPLSQPDTIQNTTIIAEDVTGMRIQYFDGSIWHQGWSRQDAPKLVRVSLSLIDGDRTDGQLSRTATFPVQVE